MQVLEFEKKGLFSTKYGLAFTIPLSPEKTIESEFRHIKEAFLEWYSSKGKKAALVHFTVLSPQDTHPHIEDFLSKVYQHEQQLSPLLKSMDVQVTLLSEKGKEIKSYKLK